MAVIMGRHKHPLQPHEPALDGEMRIENVRYQPEVTCPRC